GHTANEVRSLFLQECVKRGVLFGVPVFMSYGHYAADIADTLAAARDALDVVATALRTGTLDERLEGEPCDVLFRPAAPRAVRTSRPGRAGRRRDDAHAGT